MSAHQFRSIDQLKTRCHVSSIVPEQFKNQFLVIILQSSLKIPENKQVNAMAASQNNLLHFIMCESSERNIANSH